MQKYIAGIVLLGSLVACTSDWDPERPVSSLDSRIDAEQALSAVPRVQRAGFAALPDRGELLAYDRDREVRQSGAYTSHPIDLSEEHALRASHEAGELVVTAPDGSLLQLKYEQHVVHPDGNWTWIGSAADGTDAVLTFGEKAVFGTIPYGDQEPLRLTTMGGRGWLVATDRSKIVDVNRAVTRSGKPDYLIPPSLAASPLSSGTGMSAAAAQVEPAGTGAATIDVVLGFTNGYASQLGGASQAVTRLNNLIEIANQALANSLITRRYRLVHTLQVNYPDATSHATTLEELSAYRSGSGIIPVPAALQPLRAARDQYGGDLVSLVRAFRAPQNDGCGIAWLIGGGQAPITTENAGFGYSVIGDGSDVDENDGRTYFCREETLVHEMGHNLGQAHNSQDSTSVGVHPYSYGYRETSSTGFYTVMAYRLPDSSQIPIRHFANPGVSYQGRPTGVANTSDNARSMNLTMPIVATFRNAVGAVSASADMNADGRSDLLWHLDDRQVVYWVMNGPAVQASIYAGDAGAQFNAVGIGDFNGDRAGDIIFDARTPYGNYLRRWINNGSGAFFVYTQYYTGAWEPFGTADINGDGKDDLLWRLGTQIAYWLQDGPNVLSSVYAGDIGAGFDVAAVGDFNGDGYGDLAFANSSNVLKIWINNGNGTFTSTTRSGGGTWQAFGAADVNSDGKSDLLWRLQGQVAYWLMDGTTVQSSVYAGDAGSAFSPVAVGDYDGDGFADIIFNAITPNDGNYLRYWINNRSGYFLVYTQYYSGAWRPFDTALTVN